MKSLAALQQEFKDYVLHHDPRIESEVVRRTPPEKITKPFLFNDLPASRFAIDFQKRIRWLNCVICFYSGYASLSKYRLL